MMNDCSIEKKVINVPGSLNDAFDYGSAFSRAMQYTFNGMTILEVSGTASIDDSGQTVHVDDFSAQLRRTYSNLTAILEAAGAEWKDVIKTRCYIKDMKYYDEFNSGRTAFFKEVGISEFPSSVGIQVELCRPELLVEIELTAIFPAKTD